MNNKIIKTFILVTLLVLLVGLASATEVSTDTTSTPITLDASSDTSSTDTTPTVAEDTVPTTTDTVQESVTSKQTDKKDAYSPGTEGHLFLDTIKEKCKKCK